MVEVTTMNNLPDLQQGVAAADFDQRPMVVGRVGEDEVLLVKSGEEYFAVAALCTHYHGHLVDGLLVDGTVRCPWHHACFNLRTGSVERGPALDPLDRWQVDQHDGRIFVRHKLEPARNSHPSADKQPESVLIVGGGAAGLAAALKLRRTGYQRALTLVSAETDPPYDRPNLSKDYLAGTAPEEWLPLRSEEFYRDNGIDLALGSAARKLDASRRKVTLQSGREMPFDRLLLATGATPIRLQIPGAEPDRVLYLRSWSDCRAIISRVASAKRVVVLGASFIALEVAASLRTRGLDVHIVGRDSVPMRRVLGEPVGEFLRRLHESRGTAFHLEKTIASIAGRAVTLSDGTTLDADLVVVGAGVRPIDDLARQAGITVNNGVTVDDYLMTSVNGIYAAGDIASWPDRRSGERLRVEHWVVAQRQGETAARNMLGAHERFTAVPFFWTQQFDLTINYVGHAAAWDRVRVDGGLEQRDCAIRYEQGGRLLALATVSRDYESLQAELELERAVA
jgi:NADPH-dependent 2,4-dienoyl-CoA reductase/sulfur reductase-like enzyme/nitrite reductase/ring-hydroxylating ferredoxin subunit